MRRGWALLLALLLAPLNGCFTVVPEHSLTRRDARSQFTAPVGDDLVIMEIALLDCTVNDPYINVAFWNYVDASGNAGGQKRFCATTVFAWAISDRRCPIRSSIC